jgi:hypothetical protein
MIHIEDLSCCLCDRNDFLPLLGFLRLLTNEYLATVSLSVSTADAVAVSEQFTRIQSLPTVITVFTPTYTPSLCLNKSHSRVIFSME